MEPIEEGNFYHIYNRGAGRNALFQSDEEFKLFIKKYFYYLYPAVETYALCILKNHFHSLIRVRTIYEQISLYENIKNGFPDHTFHGRISPDKKPYNASRQIGHLMNSYTKHMNHKKGRSGTFIEGPVKRKKVKSDTYLNHLICYIHRNPIHHKITDENDDYPYSSYTFIAEMKSDLLESVKVLECFGGLQNYIKAHEDFKINPGSNFYLD